MFEEPLVPAQQQFLRGAYGVVQQLQNHGEVDQPLQHLGGVLKVRTTVTLLAAFFVLLALGSALTLWILLYTISTACQVAGAADYADVSRRTELGCLPAPAEFVRIIASNYFGPLFKSAVHPVVGAEYYFRALAILDAILVCAVETLRSALLVEWLLGVRTTLLAPLNFLVILLQSLKSSRTWNEINRQPIT